MTLNKIQQGVMIDQQQQQMADFLFCFKKHLWNDQSKFNETLQEASLGDPLQNTTRGHDWSTTTKLKIGSKVHPKE